MFQLLNRFSINANIVILTNTRIYVTIHVCINDTTSYCPILHRFVLHYIASYCITLYYTVSQSHNASCCIVLYCIVLYCRTHVYICIWMYLYIYIYICICCSLPLSLSLSRSCCGYCVVLCRLLRIVAPQSTNDARVAMNQTSGRPS